MLSHLIKNERRNENGLFIECTLAMGISNITSTDRLSYTHLSLSQTICLQRVIVFGRACMSSGHFSAINSMARDSTAVWMLLLEQWENSINQISVFLFYSLSLWHNTGSFANFTWKNTTLMRQTPFQCLKWMKLLHTFLFWISLDRFYRGNKCQPVYVLTRKTKTIEITNTYDTDQLLLVWTWIRLFQWIHFHIKAHKSPKTLRILCLFDDDQNLKSILFRSIRGTEYNVNVSPTTLNFKQHQYMLRLETSVRQHVNKTIFPQSKIKTWKLWKLCFSDLLFLQIK